MPVDEEFAWIFIYVKVKLFIKIKNRMWDNIYFIHTYRRPIKLIR
jgi:hypothetical protein